MNGALSILLLEDDAVRAERISALLSGTGQVRMEHCRALPEALETLNRSNCAACILDMDNGGLPGLDSYRVLHHSTPELPVLLITGNTASQEVAQALREGAEETLVLDEMDGRLLLKSIHHAIENRKRKDYLQRLLFTIEQIPTSILMADYHGDVDYVNSRFGALTGYMNHEIVGENIGNGGIGIFDSELFLAITDCVREKSEREGGTVITTKNGEKRWVHYSISPIKNIDNIISHFVASIDDVTELKAQEAKIRRSEEKFRALVSNINEYVYSVDYRDGRAVATFHSPRCEKITGYRAEEFLADDRLWYSMIHETDKDCVTEFLKGIQEGQDESSIEHRILHKDGSVRWVSNTCTLLRDADGAMSALYGFIVDITERKEWELQIKKLSKAIKQSPVSVIITDRSGMVEYVNPKFTETTGYTPGEIAGRSPLMLGPDGKDRFGDILKTVLAGREWRGELCNRKKNGEAYWEFSSVTSIRNKKGKVTHLVAVNEDITERKSVEEALRKRNEALERDLRLAQLIQKAFLPKTIPAVNGIRIDYRHIPMEKIGGDYFSIEALDGNALSVFIGDVAGHGVSAALFLSLLKSATDRMLKISGHEPDRYMAGLNGILMEEMPSFFITAVYGTFSYERGKPGATYRFSNGGHPYPVLYRSRDGSVEQLKLSGTIVGMFGEAEYGMSEVELSRGDRVFLFTDGITELENGEKEMIGMEEGLMDI